MTREYALELAEELTVAAEATQRMGITIRDREGRLIDLTGVLSCAAKLAREHYPPRPKGAAR